MAAVSTNEVDACTPNPALLGVKRTRSWSVDAQPPSKRQHTSTVNEKKEASSSHEDLATTTKPLLTFVGTCIFCNNRLRVCQPHGPLPRGSNRSLGIRSPNGLVWAATVQDLFLVPRSPIDFNRCKSYAIPGHTAIKSVRMKGLQFLDAGKIPAEVWSISMIESLTDSEEASQKTDSKRTDDSRPEIKAPFPLLLQNPDEEPPMRADIVVKSPRVRLQEVISPDLLPLRLQLRTGHSASYMCINTDSEVYPISAYPDSDASDDAEPYMVDGYIDFYDQFDAVLEIGYSWFAEGNHSRVYHGTLTLPSNVRTNHRAPGGRVSVVAKFTMPDEEAHQMLRNEAAFFRSICKSHSHLQHQWTGVNAMPGRTMPTQLHAVIPKFYGHYRQRLRITRSVGRSLGFDGPVELLLMEDCGSRINARGLSRETRHNVLAMFSNLHNAGYVHGSPHERNIMIQPGPIWQPPHERTMDCPSLRLIDFGRTSLVPEARHKFAQEYADVMKTMRLKSS